MNIVFIFIDCQLIFRLDEGQSYTLYNDVEEADWIDSLRATESPITKCLRYQKDTKSIIVIEMPSIRHEAAERDIENQLSNWVRVAGVPFNHSLDFIGAFSTYCRYPHVFVSLALTCSVIDVASTLGAEPDGAVVPRQKSRVPNDANRPMFENDKPWPNLIIEIGVSESLSHLERDAALWLGQTTTVQVVLCVKVYNRYSNGRLQLALQTWYRNSPNGNPVDHIEFGTGGVGNAPPPVNTQAAPLVLHIPTATIFFGDPVLAENPAPAWFTALGAAFHLNLWELQDRIERYVP